jgi:protein-S-isoprenylcysteine O-methyltransferase Ste14
LRQKSGISDERHHGGVQRRVAARVSALFFLLGPGLEAGLGPWLLTGGFETGGAWDDVIAPRVAGALLAAAGLGVLLHAFARFVRDGLGTPTPVAPTERLVVSGVYRHVRNPMYVATAAVIAGEGLLLSQPVLLAGAAVYLTALATLVHLMEEPGLHTRFGAQWEAYRRAVPGWLPRLRPWTRSADQDHGASAAAR